jgi:hypothetical protein
MIKNKLKRLRLTAMNKNEAYILSHSAISEYKVLRTPHTGQPPLEYAEVLYNVRRDYWRSLDKLNLVPTWSELSAERKAEWLAHAEDQIQKIQLKGKKNG